MKIIGLTVAAALAGGFAVASLAADKAEGDRKVTITYTDLTGTQPLSSSAWVSHKDGLHLWTEGKPAETTIKRLAEEGNPEFILGTAVFDGDHNFLDEAVALPAHPGHRRSVTLSVDAAHPRVSGAWMLGMTNDGFAGVDAVDAYHLSKPVTVEVYALDAGTRKDSETKAHTAALDGLEEDPENGVVSRHKGIRGDADIPASFKFDPAKPVGRVTITPAGKPGA